jgi:UDP-4-amino-4,6-dideoxy-N-acetyl-beta-L-altrosamine transaminase
MISYGKQSIDNGDIEAVKKVLKSDWLTQGPYIEEFENNLKSHFQSKAACVVSSGTAALHISSIALGWEKDNIIITSPITFLATANSIEYSGATTDFVDIDKDSYTIDVNKLEDKIKLHQSNRKMIKAVIGVDFAGHPCDWKNLRYLANKYNFILINDNCHALGSIYYNKKNYAVNFADIVTQSFHPVKHITTGEGGALLTNDLKLDKKFRELRTHGMVKEPQKMHKNDGPWYYEMHNLGYNYRITDIQCALGSNQLKKLGSFIEKRQKIAQIYNSRLKDVEHVRTPKIKKHVQHSFHLYPLLIDFDKLKISKIDFFKKMKAEGVNLQVHYIPIHFQPYYKNKYGFKRGDFEISKQFYEKEVSLPIYPDLKTEDVKNICKLIKKTCI